MITVKVKFFGQCRELIGAEVDEIGVPERTSVGAAFEVLKHRYPKLEQIAARLLFAVNDDYASLETTLSSDDTLAIFPPVSGGSEEDSFQITREPIDTPGLVKRLLRSRDGAVVAFEGVVRDHSMGQPVLYLEYEAYESMAMKMFGQIADEVHERWPVDRIGIIHRLGRLEIGQTSVAIVVTSAHRRVAFEACRYAIDRLKKIVPIWKREFFEDGAVWGDGEGCSHDERPVQK